MAIPTTIGRYEVLEEIGRGSMGVVYKARDPRIGRIVALKCVSFNFPLGPGEEEEFLRRFYHEAQIAGRLNHPNIVTIHDVGEKGAEGAAFIAMEYVTGTNLQDLMAGGGRLPLTQIADICAQVADALDYAHENGVVHRDIKPGNLVLTTAGQLKILDFGIARVAAANVTRPGRFLGTPNYMAPEQVTGTAVDGRADQFALGVTLFHLMTGERPFVGESVTAISYQVVNVMPPPPSRLNPTVPAAADRVVERALAKSPADRYPKCKDLADELKAAVSAWKEAADKVVPRTLVSSVAASTNTSANAPIPSGSGPAALGWLAHRGPGALFGWALCLIGLAMLAAAPYLLRGSTRRPVASPSGVPNTPWSMGAPPAGGRPSSAGLVAPAPVAAPVTGASGTVGQEAPATLLLNLQHRLESGEITARVDGVQVLRERIKGKGTKTHWTRELPIPSGTRRVEVRLRGDGGAVDDIEGIDMRLRPHERKVLSITVSPLTKRVRLREGDPASEASK